jgi:hypothetical protein
LVAASTVGPCRRRAVELPGEHQQIYPKIWYNPLNPGSIDWRLGEIRVEITYVNP